MIDPDADPDQLDLGDALPSRQASFAFWRPSPSPCEAAPMTSEQEGDSNQLALPLTANFGAAEPSRGAQDADPFSN
jgi:hypothetical protein